MQSVNAEQGRLVSWKGFKTSVYKESPANFFQIRLWDQEILLDEMLAVYNKLDEDVKTEIPLKQIWSLAAHDEEDE